MERVAVARRVWREWLEVTRGTRRVQCDTARRVTVTPRVTLRRFLSFPGVDVRVVSSHGLEALAHKQV